MTDFEEMAREILEYWYGPHYGVPPIPKLHVKISAALRAARNEALEEAALFADAEPELMGEIPEANLIATRKDPANSLRAAVRCTKRNIAAAIRARKDK